MVKNQTAALAIEGLGERVGFEQLAAGETVDIAIREGLLVFKRLLIGTHDHGELHFADKTVAIGDHLRNFKVGIDMNERKRDMPKEGFASKPKEDSAILAHRPQHAQTFEIGIGFP